MFITPDFRLKRRIPFNLICAVLLFLAASQAAMADELAIWNFNDSNLNVDHGSGILTTTHQRRERLVCCGNKQQRPSGRCGRAGPFLTRWNRYREQWSKHHLQRQHGRIFEYCREFCDAGDQHRIQQQSVPVQSRWRLVYRLRHAVRAGDSVWLGADRV